MNAGGVPHNGNGSERSLAQPEINCDRVPDLDFPVNDGTQSTLAEIKTDAFRTQNATWAQMTDGDGNAEQRSDMSPGRQFRMVAFNLPNMDRHRSSLLAGTLQLTA